MSKLGTEGHELKKCTIFNNHIAKTWIFKDITRFVLTLLLVFLVDLLLPSRSFAQDQSKVIESFKSLEEFNDIAIIQRKYLKKTARFEVWGSLLTTLNSQFFNIFGLNGTATYHFSERWALEGNFILSTDLEKSFTENIEREYFIQTKDFVTPESYFGLALRWSPIYGKISLQEKTINPFEVYFSLGGGVTLTDDGQSAPTLHLGIGQMYPLSRNTTFRWDIGFNGFIADGKDSLNGPNQGESITTYMLYVSAGVSVFLPYSNER